MFRKMVRLIFKLCAPDHQVKWIAAGQPKELRFKALGIRHFTPTTSFMPVLSNELAQVITKAILVQLGKFTKEDLTDLEANSLRKPLRDLSLKGVPRWHIAPKWLALQATWPNPPMLDAVVDHEAELNVERWLICPSCKKGQHTAGMPLLNAPGGKNGLFAFVYCKQCKKQTKSGGWTCLCLRKWHQCDLHSRDHLHGKKQKRRTPEELAEVKRARFSTASSEMPSPCIAPIPTRKRKATDVAVEEQTNLNSVLADSAGTRRPLSLPPSLAAKFPHLAKR